jgi:deoxyribose-phosphate aldolase
MHVDELAKTIDHTLLRADAPRREVEALCREADHYHFATVCILPCWVSLAAELLRASDVRVCTVISFPHGADTARIKIAAAEEAVAQGADELDVVINLPALLSGDVLAVRDELRAVVNAVRLRSVNSGKGAVIVKVIIETCYLNNKMKRLACRVAEMAGADFVKTSTGTGPKGATAHDVELLRDALGEHVGVKASGGIRSLADVERMLNAGASRIGTSAGVAIMRDFMGETAGAGS